jgi:hypothetical protein
MKITVQIKGASYQARRLTVLSQKAHYSFPRQGVQEAHFSLEGEYAELEYVEDGVKKAVLIPINSLRHVYYERSDEV